MSFETSFEDAVKSEDIPGAVLMASDKSGKFKYMKEFGHRSVNEGAKPFDQHTFMWSASCTKLLAAISVLRCVELGLLTLDEDVSCVLPELGEKQILSMSEDGDMSLSPTEHVITYRQLLTHTSGTALEMIHPTLMTWMASRGETPTRGRSIPDSLNAPLVFEPGTSWFYSTGNDWAGLAVERVNRGQNLQSFMEQHIFQPLGIDGITFFPHDRPDLVDRIAETTSRNPQTGKLKSKLNLGPPVEACYGGGGAYLVVPEYMKVLQSLMANDGKVLKPESVEELFRPQLSEQNAKAMHDVIFSSDNLTRIMSKHMPQDREMNFSLGGMICMDEYEGFRGKGTMMWGGIPNITWFIDREQGLYGMMGAQLMPAGDPTFTRLGGEFEKGVYELYNKSGSARL